jgi:hypothetical protein
VQPHDMAPEHSDGTTTAGDQFFYIGAAS